MSVTFPTSFFLDQFALDRRSLIASQFFAAVRAGADTVEDVIRTVKGDCHFRMVTSKGEIWTAQRQLLCLLETEEARRYAQEVIEREALPAEEKRRLKVERQERHRRDYLRARLPTERQLRFLKSLGCNETPASRLEASDLIDQRQRVQA